MEKATWLPSGEKAGLNSRAVRPTKGTTSIGGSGASAWFRENLQIPIPESSPNNVAPTDIHHVFALTLPKCSFRALGEGACEPGLSTGAMKRYPRRGSVSTKWGSPVESPSRLLKNLDCTRFGFLRG